MDSQKRPTQEERLLDRLINNRSPLDPIECWKELGISPTCFHSCLTRVKRRLEGTTMVVKHKRQDWDGKYGKTYFFVYWLEDTRGQRDLF